MLFSLIAQGDEKAFEELFYLYLPKLKPVLFRMLKSDMAVKDLLQEIFMSLWLGREKLEQVESPSKWIFRIAFNRALNWLEQQAVHTNVHREIAASLPDAGTEETVQQLQFQETARLVQQAVHDLPPQAKKIYLLSRERGLKAREIAEELGLSVQTVKNTQLRAAKHIREYLLRHGVYVPLVLVAFFL